MKNNQHVAFWIGALLLGLSTTAQALLYDRGNGMIYDDQLRITWLADASYAATQWDESGGKQGYRDGRMSWYQADHWASELEYGGYSDWRLPDIEMVHMFYVNLGGILKHSEQDATDPNGYLDLIKNLKPEYYWSGLEDGEKNELTSAYLFSYEYGEWGSEGKSGSGYAWAIHPGDVGAAEVSEPGVLLLFGAGLVCFGFTRRAYKHRRLSFGD
ncbi:MAG: DUF1566 domain-containing protein [Gammaproteobacteria bacterium]|nr:DUF1566 domain-containing protein [Gammaproteobacteria bacterium]